MRLAATRRRDAYYLLGVFKVNCRKVSHFLSAYIDGELPGVEYRQIHEHVAQCAACAQEHRSLLQMKRLLAGMQVREAQADLPARLLAKVHAQAQHAAPPRSWRQSLQTLQNALPGNAAGSLWERAAAQQPRFQHLAIAAGIAIVGIVYASYAIDRSDEIQWHTATPTEIASLPPAPAQSPDAISSILPPAAPTPDAPWQTVGNTSYTTSYPDPLLPMMSPPRASIPPSHHIWGAPSFFNRR